MRKAFSFYRSHYEQMKLMNKTQIADLVMAICEVQFLEIHPDDILFKDKVTELVWVGTRHGVEASVKGYVSKKGGISTPLPRGSKNVLTPLEQGEGEEEEKEKEKEKGKGEQAHVRVRERFSFTLSKKQSYDNVSETYKQNLKAKCLITDGNLERYEAFIISLESGGYQYKDFSKTYMAWDKEKNYQDYKPIPEPTLGEEWIKVKIGDGKIIAVNTVTFEMKEGKVTKQAQAPEVEAPVNNRAVNMVKHISKGF